MAAPVSSSGTTPAYVHLVLRRREGVGATHVSMCGEPTKHFETAMAEYVAACCGSTSSMASAARLLRAAKRWCFSAAAAT